MSTPFPQTTRALRSDNTRLLVLLLPIALLVLGLWIFWMLHAEVTRYETSSTAFLRNRMVIMAEFSPAALSSLRAGQPAHFRLDDLRQSRAERIPATLIYTKSKPGSAALEVRLKLQLEGTSSRPLQPGQTGVVEVEVERVSPATLFWRSIDESTAKRE